MGRDSRTAAPPLRLSAPLRELRGIGPRRAEAFADDGIATLEDLLLNLPFRYEDRGKFASIHQLAPGSPVTVRSRIRSARLLRTRIRGFTIFEVQIEDETGSAAARWYNQPFLRNVLKEGSELVLYGEPNVREKGAPRLLFSNPQFELLGQDPAGIHTGRIVPIYRRTGGLSTRSLRTLVHRALQVLPEELEDPLPAAMVLRMRLEDRVKALRNVHFPLAGTQVSLLEKGLTPSHRRLALEELYRLQCAFARSRRLRASQHGIPCPLSDELRNRLAACCPFALTKAQERTLQEILADLAGGAPMARLLQGDVGCGKTMVALLASVAVMENGQQVAWMVPTEILAEQHTRRVAELLRETCHEIALLSSQSRNSSGGKILRSIEEGRTRLVIGTQALIQESVRFRRLALVVVDEQHRFGVRQREILRGKGTEPHQLFMTATPIPRSLAMALYGDLDVSLIDEMPPGRKPVRTVIRASTDRARIYRFIREEVGRGGRAAIVVPSIQERKQRPEGSALKIYSHISDEVFPDLKVGLLHGALSRDDRRRAMEGFSSGEVQVLVTTTVLEVGVDVPEASVMVVEQADAFGLAQLHQIRGRIGRGNRSSWCILIPADRSSPLAKERLKILEEVSDGFEIAHRDLALRGPGEFLGLRQSGAPDFRVAEFPRDLDLLEVARQESVGARSSAGDP